MELISHKKCMIGEGPIWNDRKGLLYFTNGIEKEFCQLDLQTGALTVCSIDPGATAIAFDEQDRMIVSQPDGVFLLEGDTRLPLYDTAKYRISHANDMKVGPDGRIYVGTQSEKRKKLSDRIDGKLYSIDANGTVRVLLDGLLLSNGMEWSMDETRFYHTDSDTRIIKEYLFDRASGDITPTGRELYVPGVDGFTIDQNDDLYIACWGQGHVAVASTLDLQVREYIPVPAKKPASCAFAGTEMDQLIVVTANYGTAREGDENAGCTFGTRLAAKGRAPYRFASGKK